MEQPDFEFVRDPELAAEFRRALALRDRNNTRAWLAVCIRSCDATPEEAEAIRQQWESNGERL